MGICFLEKKYHRISEISFLPSLKAKLLFPVCDGIPCRAPNPRGVQTPYQYCIDHETTIIDDNDLENATRNA